MLCGWGRSLLISIGLYEFVRKGDPPVMGITKLENGLTRDEVMRPRMKLPPPALPVSAGRLPTTSPP